MTLEKVNILQRSLSQPIYLTFLVKNSSSGEFRMITILEFEPFFSSFILVPLFHITMSHQIPNVCEDEHKAQDPINKTTLRVTNFS